MCTLISCDRSIKLGDIQQQILTDSRSNADGWALLTVDDIGEFSLLRTLSLSVVLAVLRETPWERFWLHSRSATQGRPALENTHGWFSAGVFYFHNGVLQNAASKGLSVDSKLIGRWLKLGPQYAVDQLKTEPFANVFFVCPGGNWWAVSRSTVGRLFTDGADNFSTCSFGDIKTEVLPGSVLTIDLPTLDRREFWNEYSWSDKLAY